MNEIRIFENKEFGKIRTVSIDSEPWFVGKDVAEILGYSNPRDALAKRVDDEDKGVANCDTLGGKQEMTVINESGLYSLILSSKLPKAKEFKRWVTSEVLPSVRKNGAYMTPETIQKALLNPDFVIELAMKLKQEQQKVKELAPKAEFYDTVKDSTSLLSMSDVAKILDMGYGRNKIYAILREKGILDKRNIPYQCYVDRGYFKVIESNYMAGDNPVVVKTTYIKQKGVDYIRKVLKEVE